MKKVNLLIPINGSGTRFRNDGYEFPKPLINILGKKMIFWVLDNLDLSKVYKIIIPYSHLLNRFLFCDLLRERYPNVSFEFINIEYPTKGAAETIRIGLHKLSNSVLQKRIMVLDCDTIYFENIISKYINGEHKDVVFYFDNDVVEPIYSYIIKNGKNVTNIREKEKISNFACSGVYCFSSGTELLKYSNLLIKSNKLQKNEFYISGIYQLMLSDSRPIYCEKVDNFTCVGTPLQLKVFCENYNETQNKRICFDLDKTLVSPPQIPGEYSTVLPIEKNINFLRFLKQKGNTIIIYTARRMRTHKGNVGLVIGDIAKTTLDTLKKFDIPYDEIYFGKPYANFYIDDLAVKAMSDLEKELGFYNSIIRPRAFNKIKVFESVVKKQGQICGEKHFYKSIKQFPKISKYFPNIHPSRSNELVMERISGLNFSYLLNSNCLLEEYFAKFLSAVNNIHKIKMKDSCEITASDIKDFYLRKLQTRSSEVKYNTFVDNDKVFKAIRTFIEGREISEENICIIHGDPVFTNVFIDIEKNIKLIDMRGMIGNKETIYGDPVYDLAKIYQSIAGYDCILNNTPVILNEALNDKFFTFVKNKYNIGVNVIQKMTAYLLYTLIPLHDTDKSVRFFNLCKQILGIK